jgi:hypothetical protein
MIVLPRFPDQIEQSVHCRAPVGLTSATHHKSNRGAIETIRRKLLKSC